MAWANHYSDPPAAGFFIQPFPPMKFSNKFQAIMYFEGLRGVQHCIEAATIIQRFANVQYAIG